MHEQYCTTLIETFSHERVEGCLTEVLATKLAHHVTLSLRPADQIFDLLAELGRVDAFTRTLATSLRHCKSVGITLEQCRTGLASASEKARSQAFLQIFALF